jgi:hypothetical protein
MNEKGKTPSEVPLTMFTVTGVHAGVARHVNDILFQPGSELTSLILPRLTQMTARFM